MDSDNLAKGEATFRCSRVGVLQKGSGSVISVIVPVWNDRESLEALLPRLLEEPGSPEIIVVDGGSRDGSVEAARRFPSVRLVESDRGRGCQMNCGAAVASGDVLLFLHSDTRPSRGAIAGLPELLDSREGDFGAFRLRFDPPVWLPSLLAFFTRLARPWTCFGDQGIFVRREFFRATGGFPEIPVLEDVHWLRLAGKHGRMTRSPHTVVTSARRFEQMGSVRQTWRNLSILLRDLAGQAPGELAALYEKGYRPDGVPGPRDAEVIAEAAVSAERS